MPRFFSVAVLAIVFVGSAVGEDINTTLQKAKQTYTDANVKARAVLLEGFDAAIKKADASGVKTLQEQQKTFETNGTLPTSPRMKSAVATYHTAMKQPVAAMEKAYEQAIKDLTQVGNFADVEILQNELKEFRVLQPGTINLPPSEVETKEDLQKHLIGTTWTWDDGLTFKADGYVAQRGWEARGLTTKWEAVDRRTVVFWIEKGRETQRYAILTFSEDLSEFRGYDFHWERMGPRKRKP